MFFQADLWYLLPLGFLIATVAISSGISGSNFWIPVYMFILGVETRTGFWLALLTMLFGFGSGVVRNLLAGSINWPLVLRYGIVCLPAAIAAAVCSTHVPASRILFCFAIYVFCYGIFLIYKSASAVTSLNPDIKKPQWLVALFAGFLNGLIATGPGALLVPVILRHKEIRSAADTVGTTVLLVFAVSLASLLARMDHDLTTALLSNKHYIASVMLWVAPGVIAGGQLGPVVARRLSKKNLQIYLGTLLVGVGILVFTRL